MNQSIKNTTGKQLRTNEVAMTMNASSKQFSDQNGTVKNRFQILQVDRAHLG